VTVTYDNPVNVGGNSWRLSWTSDSEDPCFYIYDLCAGRLIATTTDTSIVVALEAGARLVVEVREAAYTKIPRGYPRQITLFWFRVTATSYYLVEEYVVDTWTARARVYDTGAGSFRYVTRYLDDETSYQWRVTPVGTNGNSGTAKAWTVLVVGYPDPVAATLAHDDETVKVTISAA